MNIGDSVQLDVAEEVKQGEVHVRTQLQNTEVLTAWEILRRLSLATTNPVQHQVLLSVYIFVVKLPYILRISFKRPTTKFGPNRFNFNNVWLVHAKFQDDFIKILEEIDQSLMQIRINNFQVGLPLESETK